MAIATSRKKPGSCASHHPQRLSEEELREVAAIFTTLDDQSDGWLAVPKLKSAVAYVTQRAKGPLSEPVDPTALRMRDPWMLCPNDPLKQFHRLIHNATSISTGRGLAPAPAAGPGPGLGLGPLPSCSGRGGVPFEEFKTAMAPVVAAVRRALDGSGPADDAALLAHFHEFAVLQVFSLNRLIFLPFLMSVSLFDVPASTGRRP